MTHSERARSSWNGAASLGQRAVSPRPPSALRQNQLASPCQAELALCEQTIFARSSPSVVTCMADGSSQPVTLDSHELGTLMPSQGPSTPSGHLAVILPQTPGPAAAQAA